MLKIDHYGIEHNVMRSENLFVGRVLAVWEALGILKDRPNIMFLANNKDLIEEALDYEPAPDSWERELVLTWRREYDPDHYHRIFERDIYAAYKETREYLETIRKLRTMPAKFFDAIGWTEKIVPYLEGKRYLTDKRLAMFTITMDMPYEDRVYAFARVSRLLGDWDTVKDLDMDTRNLSWNSFTAGLKKES